MPRPHPPLRQRQSNTVPAVPSASGVAGGTTAVSVGLDSSLLLGPTGSPVPSVTNPLDPNNPVITITDSSSHQTSPTSSSTSAILHTSSSLSTGAVLGISVAVFVVAIAAMLAVYTLFKRRTYARVRRPPPRGSPSTSRVEGGNRSGGGDKWERLGGDKPPTREVIPPAPPKTPEIGKFDLFAKDPSVRSVSDEKASHTFDPATMPNFVQYHPALAEELTAPSRPFASGSGAEGSQVVSWSGETAADSFLSLRTSGSMSSSAVVTRQTPTTTDSTQHRWESAEVLIMDEASSPLTERPSVYSEISPNPFRDDASRTSFDGNEADTRASSSNPFFNASQHNPFSDRSSRSRKSSVSTVKRSRSDSIASRRTVRVGDNALLSLIAALDSKGAATEDQSVRTSMQTTSTSRYSASIVPPKPKAF